MNQQSTIDSKKSDWDLVSDDGCIIDQHSGLISMDLLPMIDFILHVLHFSEKYFAWFN